MNGSGAKRIGWWGGQGALVLALLATLTDGSDATGATLSTSNRNDDAAQPVGPPSELMTSPPPPPEDRNWSLRLVYVFGGLDAYDVFGLDEDPLYRVREPGHGAGIAIGRRVSRRFAIGLCLNLLVHDTEPMVTANSQANPAAAIATASSFAAFALELTGALELRSAASWRPYITAGVGAAGASVDTGPSTNWVAGSSVTLGLGSRLYLSPGFSLEAALHGQAINRQRAGRRYDDTAPEGEETEWDLRGAIYGWRCELGAAIWF